MSLVQRFRKWWSQHTNIAPRIFVSFVRQRILLDFRLFAHTLETMYGSHPADHSVDLELLGYDCEDFVTSKFLPMRTNLGKEKIKDTPIVSYLTTDESAFLKQLTLIYPTAEALKKDETMPKMFPLIVFTVN